jgi:hypothetical protein
MKTVFICYGWMTGEDDPAKATCAVFEKEEDAFVFCQDAQAEAEDVYQYNYKEWEVL